MASERLTDLINAPTPDEQESVSEFVQFWKSKNTPRSAFLNAVDEFIEEHPELLRRLAQ